MHYTKIRIILSERFILRLKDFYHLFPVTGKKSGSKFIGVVDLRQTGKVNPVEPFKIIFKERDHLFIGFKNSGVKYALLFKIKKRRKNNRKESKNRSQKKRCLFSYAAGGFNHNTAPAAERFVYQPRSFIINDAPSETFSAETDPPKHFTAISAARYNPRPLPEPQPFVEK